MVNCKHPSHGVTIFTLSIFSHVDCHCDRTTVRMSDFSALRSSKSPGTSFVRDKEDSFDLSVICMRIQLQDNGVILMKDQV